MNNPPQVCILTTEFKTNMITGALPLISIIRQTMSGQLQTVPDEKLLANELELSRIELEARRLTGSKSEGDV